MTGATGLPRLGRTVPSRSDHLLDAFGRVRRGKTIGGQGGQGPALQSSSDGEAGFVDDFLRRVTETQGRLSVNDLRVATHVREHLRELPFHTADSLAEQVGVSRAGVIRLTQRLGYQGFAEFRNRSRADLRESDSPLQRFDPKQEDSLLSAKVDQAIANLGLTQELASHHIPRAVEMLSSAPRVYIAGNGKSYALAVYLHHLLHGVRRDVHLISPAYRQEATDFTPEDLFVLCIFQRYHRESLKLLSYASAHHVATLVITDGGGHHFLRDVTLALVGATDSSTLYRSMIAPVLLIETLVAEVAKAQPAAARAVLAAAEDFNRGHEFLSRSDPWP